jgi:hypothetical protein
MSTTMSKGHDIWSTFMSVVGIFLLYLVAQIYWQDLCLLPLFG